MRYQSVLSFLTIFFTVSCDDSTDIGIQNSILTVGENSFYASNCVFFEGVYPGGVSKYTIIDCDLRKGSLAGYFVGHTSNETIEFSYWDANGFLFVYYDENPNRFYRSHDGEYTIKVRKGIRTIHFSTHGVLCTEMTDENGRITSDCMMESNDANGVLTVMRTEENPLAY